MVTRRCSPLSQRCELPPTRMHESPPIVPTLGDSLIVGHHRRLLAAAHAPPVDENKSAVQAVNCLLVGRGRRMSQQSDPLSFVASQGDGPPNMREPEPYVGRAPRMFGRLGPTDPASR